MESAIYKNAPAGTKVIETFGFDPDRGGVHNIQRHMERAAATCKLLGFGFDRGSAFAQINEQCYLERLRIRMLISKSGRVEIEAQSFKPETRAWNIKISNSRLKFDDPWLGVKTTQRDLYDTERSKMPGGIDELIYFNEQDELCEGTITNIFIPKRGKLITPQKDCGLLPGTFRQELLDQGVAETGILHLEDLKSAKAIYIGNSLRGLLRAKLIS
ncbi:MAG: aminotransferase class IV [Pseudomonadota bacterium]